MTESNSPEQIVEQAIDEWRAAGSAPPESDLLAKYIVQRLRERGYAVESDVDAAERAERYMIAMTRTHELLKAGQAVVKALAAYGQPIAAADRGPEWQKLTACVESLGAVGDGGADDRMRPQLHPAEKLLLDIRNGKHSLPGTLVQIDRYFFDYAPDGDPTEFRG